MQDAEVALRALVVADHDGVALDLELLVLLLEALEAAEHLGVVLDHVQHGHLERNHEVVAGYEAASWSANPHGSRTHVSTGGNGSGVVYLSLNCDHGSCSTATMFWYRFLSAWRWEVR